MSSALNDCFTLGTNRSILSFIVCRIAAGSLVVAACCLLGLAHSDFKNAGIGVTLTLALLGVVLNVGLTASSVAIMNSTPAEKAGTAGALEATSYDLGAGLGITAFGIVISSSYAKHIIWPECVPVSDAASRFHRRDDVVRFQVGKGCTTRH